MLLFLNAKLSVLCVFDCIVLYVDVCRWLSRSYVFRCVCSVMCADCFVLIVWYYVLCVVLCVFGCCAGRYVVCCLLPFEVRCMLVVEYVLWGMIMTVCVMCVELYVVCFDCSVLVCILYNIRCMLSDTSYILLVMTCKLSTVSYGCCVM